MTGCIPTTAPPSPNLGPAFFTKYLYFAGGGQPQHPCAILDANVALALQKTCGWTSLPLKGWLASAYQRYATLLQMWVDEHSRRDTLERWLFEEGKRVRRDARGRPRSTNLADLDRLTR
ncbi:hypothetical protein DE4576_04945 [Mycobacterium marinum]|uniref:8-oxoguanine DNA glycosylase OGG fold protein n=1 Tax=Mycobacterium marinum TaxID=1781 RepID=UPI000ECE6DCD|nr:hypothetical protein [Mycobacterium marinum]RFZ63006.1 hypothetical protein DE4576_04945 [Mycobacterium marinum]